MNQNPYGRYGVDDRGGDPYPVRGAVRYTATEYTQRRRHGYTGAEEVTGARPSPRRSKVAMPLWQELPLLLVVAFCLAVLIRTFLLQAFFIPSASMNQTLLEDDRVLVNKIVHDIREPQRGEVVVFRGTDNWDPESAVRQGPSGFLPKLGRTVGDLVGVSQPGEKDFIKRVIGLPGDLVACCDAQGRVSVNGYSLDESAYLFEDSPLRDPPSGPGECGSRRFGPVTVEPGQMWVMGDNRAVSQDSRCQGQVPLDNVIGRAFVIVWPQERWASLPVPATFANVPRPFSAAPDPASVREPRTRPPDNSYGAVFALPIAAAAAVPARSRRRGWIRPRRLPT